MVFYVKVKKKLDAIRCKLRFLNVDKYIKRKLRAKRRAGCVQTVSSDVAGTPKVIWDFIYYLTGIGKK